jgi:hypothetical protein
MIGSSRVFKSRIGSSRIGKSYWQMTIVMQGIR